MKKRIFVGVLVLVAIFGLRAISADAQSASYNLGTTTLRSGSRGAHVVELQRFLNDELNLGLVLDGKLGPITAGVIREWQRVNNLKADGLVGPQTRAFIAHTALTGGGTSPVSSAGIIVTPQLSNVTDPTAVTVNISASPEKFYAHLNDGCEGNEFCASKLSSNADGSGTDIVTLTWVSDNAQYCESSGEVFGWGTGINGEQTAKRFPTTGSVSGTIYGSVYRNGNPLSSNNKTFTIVCFRSDYRPGGSVFSGQNGIASVNVPIIVPGTPLLENFQATPTSITAGEPVTLTWSSLFTDSCSGGVITGGDSADWGGYNKPTSGTKVIYPSLTTTYNLSCQKGNISSNPKSLTVVVHPSLAPITVTLRAVNPSIAPGDSTRLYWTASTNAKYCQYGWEGRSSGPVLDVSLGSIYNGSYHGNIDVQPTTTTNYVFSCSRDSLDRYQQDYIAAVNRGDIATAQSSVTVVATPPPSPGNPTVTLDAEPGRIITTGGSSTLRWTASTNSRMCHYGFIGGGATDVVNVPISGIGPYSGSITVSPSATRTYVFSCTKDTSYTTGRTDVSRTVIVDITPSPSAVPQTPTGLTATPESAEISLNWNAVAGATGYKLYRGTSGRVSDLSLLASPVGTHFSNTSVVAGTTYYYSVSAYNSSRESFRSAIVSATYTGPTPPAVPTGLTVTPNSATNQMIVRWNAVTGANGYHVYKGTSSVTLTPQGAYATREVMFSATPGTTYYFAVSAYNAAGESIKTTPVSATQPPYTGEVPTGGVTVTLRALPESITAGDLVRLEWTASSNVMQCHYGTEGGTEVFPVQAGTYFGLSGSIPVRPTRNTTYVFACTKDISFATSRAVVSKTVTVTPAAALPEVTFTATPPSIQSGQSTNLSLSATGASYCRWPEIKGTQNLYSFPVLQTAYPTATHTYTATCYNSAGVPTTANVIVTINSLGQAGPACTIDSLTASPLSGGSSTVSWTTSNCDTVYINKIGQTREVVVADGSKVFSSITSQTNVELTGRQRITSGPDEGMVVDISRMVTINVGAGQTGNAFSGFLDFLGAIFGR